MHDGKTAEQRPAYYEEFNYKEGTLLDSLEDAQREAVKGTGGLLGQYADEFWRTSEWSLDVADDAGLTLFSLTTFATWIIPIKSAVPRFNLA